MPRAAVDPEELQRFAAELKRFNAEMRGQVAGIHRHFQRLGETWLDQEQASFADEFQRMVASLGRFLDASDAQVPVLLRKAVAIRQYLQRG